jgi:hypothetical protein
MSRPAVYRYVIDVDDRWHTFDLSGAVLHVGTRRPDQVEFWALHSGGPTVEREFRVYGTGQPLDDDCRYVGTTFAATSALVWHLMERGT